MTLPWFRFYHEFASDPVVQCLAFDDQRHFVMVLCLKASGLLDRHFPSSDVRHRTICRALGLDPLTGTETQERLIGAALVGADWQPINWEKRQFRSDVSTGRVRDFRQRQKEESKNSEIQIQIQRETVPETFQERFIEFKALYPKRAGSQPWTKAEHAIRARLADGATWDDIIEGVRRYAAFCAATGKVRTEYVLQASTFCGPDKRFLEEWSAPATKADTRLTANLIAAEEFMRRTDAT